MRVSRLVAFVGICSLFGSAAAAPPLPQLNVVELYQSQGCSSCPPANAYFIELSGRPDILALSFDVTYWDGLGWKDTFASQQYTDRQWAYAHSFHRSEVFTPEIVVNGRADLVGQNLPEIESAIRRVENAGAGPSLEIKDGAVAVGPGHGKARILLVRYNPRLEQVTIGAGENEGRTLPYKNVVRELIDLGRWSGQPQTYALPPARDAGLSMAVLVQDDGSGVILSAARS